MNRDTMATRDSGRASVPLEERDMPFALGAGR